MPNSLLSERAGVLRDVFCDAGTRSILRAVAPDASVDEDDAEAGFQVADRLRDRRLGGAQAAGGLCHAAPLDHMDEDLQGPQVQLQLRHHGRFPADRAAPPGRADRDPNY